MFSYMIGKVASVNQRSITFENNYTGYVIYVSNPKAYEPNKTCKLYLYKHLTTGNKNNLVEELYGFQKYESKQMFIMLIGVSGIGPKTANAICKNDIGVLKQLIAKRDAQSLSVMEGITPKYARIIIDNLCDDFTDGAETTTVGNIDVTQLVQALKSLGYAAKEIEFALKNVDMHQQHSELSDLISQAIKIIARNESHAEVIKSN
ncbi:Holliday junction ATP-dependent DNA helicase RuvA [Bacilli bacterium]|nr:Holliday junction ATP-dependent DNA helicase RuvA [Bacilli bacterium]